MTSGAPFPGRRFNLINLRRAGMFYSRHPNREEEPVTRGPLLVGFASEQASRRSMMSEMNSIPQRVAFKIGWGILLFFSIGNVLGHIGLSIFESQPTTVFVAWAGLNFLAAGDPPDSLQAQGKVGLVHRLGSSFPLCLGDPVQSRCRADLFRRSRADGSRPASDLSHCFR